MTDEDRHKAANDDESRQQPATTINTVNANVVTTVMQAGVITGGVHNDQLAALDRALATVGICRSTWTIGAANGKVIEAAKATLAKASRGLPLNWCVQTHPHRATTSRVKPSADLAT
ncbi:hypothetical protein [Kutzneria buriramensis]|uniref:Uncharacterized protein n=1 Tax=Kutzneria buriramensis TaxID=1045776 RepID=A0A3E0I966_9PSEU|nr:hypothetical protein [Kutzneria buriramensis]REH55197.1 hypothetical protein BCF44_101214 [Kutzneria buriramensis]